MPPKKTQEEVSRLFESKRCKLLSTYKGPKIPLLFICFCGSEGTTTYQRVRSASFSGCQECLRKKSGKLNQKEAGEIFERKGFKLLSEYKGCHQKLRFLCSCGKEAEVACIGRAKKEDWHGCPSCKSEGVKRTCFQRYGATCPLQAPKIREKIVDNWKGKWGYDNPLSVPEIQEKCRDGMIRNHGVEYTTQSVELKEKIKESNKKKFGVDNPMKCEEVKEKLRETISKRTEEERRTIREKKDKANLERHGHKDVMKNPEISQKHKESIIERDSDPIKMKERSVARTKTCMEKYNVPNPMMDENVKKKGRETYKSRTGYDHPSHNPEVISKITRSCFRKKEFVMPSGAVFLCQGYEPLALRILLDGGIAEEDVLSPSNEKITISYFFEGRERIYHPDIFVKSENMLIEVKSDWTLEGLGGIKTSERQKTMEKLKSCREQGYNTRLYVFDKREKLVLFQEKLSTKYF
ncbi:putative MutH/Vsr/archaeal HJR-like endonuclease [Tunisvirus fontaine2]|uniref:Putative MutH/Vsr/archaeal HJR-like endonuclease n=1 Tax=Tunisvirus fontaine2 TaxID=1421067 RepID=V9SEZ8_9VIRU|nr:putative MutH/Vsr/archaeal HJR-like endonuclease [Tunisvirus fontaine2]AHC54891.1 putative MutH/Vsr/archaeal HJR-like endonuclease [Tunisvirus fontaine2]